LEALDLARDHQLRAEPARLSERTLREIESDSPFGNPR